MNKETKYELNSMLSLMERMDKHLTKEQAEFIDESLKREAGILNEAVERNNDVTMAGNVYALSTPEDLIKVLSKEDMSPENGWRVTLGYIKKFDKLGNKNIKSAVDSFDSDAVTAAKGLNSPRLDNLINNQVLNRKGQITNPYVTDSYTNFIVEANIVMLMYGRNKEYGVQKNAVRDELAQYQIDNPDNVQHYLDAKGMIDFAKQSYDDARATSKVKIPNVNGHQYDNGSYELNFNTPKTVYKKLKTCYFLITNENNVEEISVEEAQAYARLYGLEAVHRVNNDDDIVKQVDADIKAIKDKYHGGDIWTQYNLDSVFLMNFSTNEDNSQKLQYYNPDAMIEFVKGRELKSGTIPSRRTAKGVFKPFFDKMK